jgi:type I restriction enzyme M protein
MSNNGKNRHDRTATWSQETPEGRRRSFTYEELLQRDKVSLNIFWILDKSLENSANLPEPDMLVTEIMGDLQTALGQFALIAADLDTNRITLMA